MIKLKLYLVTRRSWKFSRLIVSQFAPVPGKSVQLDEKVALPTVVLKQGHPVGLISFQSSKMARLLQTTVAFALLLGLLGDGVNVEASRRRRHSASASQKRIIGGTRAEKGETPWLVALQGRMDAISRVYCGGSLIGQQWILTAAHCVYEPVALRNAGKWQARLGTRDLNPGLKDKAKSWFGGLIGKKDWTYVEDDITKIIIHPNYNPQATYSNDVALMKLKKPVPNDHKYIKVVDLPPNNDLSYPPNNVTCFFAGWGCSQAGGKVQSEEQKIYFRKTPDNVCANTYGIDTSIRLCAGEFNSNQGICPGDSGGPLLCPASGDRYIQVGIASFTSRDNPGRVPGVFVRVSAYVDWIKSSIASN